jgi:hypothetical protein
MAKSIHKPHKNKSEKPSKPYPEFPLYAHNNKRWTKKIRTKTHFFGPWSDPDGAVGRMAKKDAEF